MTFATPTTVHSGLERRMDSLSHLAIAFIFGLVAGSAYYHVPALEQKNVVLERTQHTEIPKLKQQVAQVPKLQHQITALRTRAQSAESDRAVLMQAISGTAPTPKPKPQ